MRIKIIAGFVVTFLVTSPLLPCRMLGVMALPDQSLSGREADGSFHPYLLAELEELRLQGGSGYWPYNNHDGWAMTSYAKTSGNVEVQTVRSEIEAFLDEDYYKKVSLLLADADIPILIGHLRQTSSGAAGIANPHPFIYTDTHGQHYSFAHNGDLNKTGLRELIGDAWLSAHPPQTFDSGLWHSDGWSQVIDSELFFLWIMKKVEASGSLLEGITDALQGLEAQQPYKVKNFLLSDGHDLYAYRRSPAKDIYYFDGSGEAELPWYLEISNHRAIMSSPPQYGPLSAIPWIELGDRQLLVLKADGSSELHQPLLQIESEQNIPLPQTPLLSKAYPNPFNGHTIIPILVEEAGLYHLSIYDSRSREVFKTASAQLPAGKQEFSWAGQDNSGNALPSGCYFFRISGAKRISSGKLLYLK